MSREKDLLKNTIVLGLGKFLPKFIAIVTLPIITAKLTKNELGTYDLISTLIMLLLPISTLQIQSAAFRFLIDSRGDEIKSAKIITNIWLVTIPISVIISMCLTLYYSYKFELYNGIIIGLYFFVDILYTTISQISRGLSMNKLYSIGAIISSSINGVFILLMVFIENKGLFGVITSLVVSNLLGFIILFIYTNLYKYLKLSYISKNIIKDMIAYSWPMIPNNLSNWALKLSDRLIITCFLGIEANAVYAVANKIPNLLSIAQSVFVMAWQENASISVNDKDADKYYTKMFEKVFDLVLSFTAVLISFTPIIFKLLIKGDYNDAYIQMPILILGMFFYCMSAFQGGIYIAHKKTKSVGLTTIFASFVNILIDLILINSIGITAGSISTLIAYFILYIYRMIDCLKFQKLKYNIKKQIIWITIIIFMLILCFFQKITFNILNMIIGILIFLYLNKEIIQKVSNKFFMKCNYRK